jgi:hypothetical protein
MQAVCSPRGTRGADPLENGHRSRRKAPRSSIDPLACPNGATRRLEPAGGLACPCLGPFRGARPLLTCQVAAARSDSTYAREKHVPRRSRAGADWVSSAGSTLSPAMLPVAPFLRSELYRPSAAPSRQKRDQAQGHFYCYSHSAARGLPQADLLAAAHPDPPGATVSSSSKRLSSARTVVKAEPVRRPEVVGIRSHLDTDLFFLRRASSGAILEWLRSRSALSALSTVGDDEA